MTWLLFVPAYLNVTICLEHDHLLGVRLIHFCKYEGNKQKASFKLNLQILKEAD